MPTDLPELIATVKRLMAPYTGTWALCGGWALDAWLGRVTREHEDIDIAVFIDEQRLFAEQLADWRLVAHETDDAHHDDRWDGHDLAFPSHLHAAKDAPPTRELLVNERGEGSWILRREPRTSLPLARFTLPSSWGIPLMAPEAILFYKIAGDRRPRDLDDLTVTLPTLSEEQRSWLQEAIALTDPDDPLLLRVKRPGR